MKKTHFCLYLSNEKWQEHCFFFASVLSTHCLLIRAEKSCPKTLSVSRYRDGAFYPRGASCPMLPYSTKLPYRPAVPETPGNICTCARAHVQMHNTNDLWDMHRYMVSNHTPHLVTIGPAISELWLSGPFRHPSRGTRYPPGRPPK